MILITALVLIFQTKQLIKPYVDLVRSLFYGNKLDSAINYPLVPLDIHVQVSLLSNYNIFTNNVMFV